jgi:EAL domain-containing protein (putative c-di-GMP-specific phosphodiesterase class I)
VAVFDDAMRTRVLRQLELESSLRKAVDSGQFHLHYQPIVSLESGRVEGMEALVRWPHPVYGMIAPGEFIPIAEETGLIVPMGEWVFGEACRQFATWSNTLGADIIPSVSVNLSRVQLSLPSLPERLRTIAMEAGVDPAAIHLEVTESAIMSDPKQAIETLHRIKSMGFKVDMDDFGTGYSSLANLHQFPIDVLKIDRSFVSNMTRGPECAALVKTINALAQTLGITVIAEGVETSEQRSMLQALSCEHAQGYLYSRPLPAHDVPGYLLSVSNSLRPMVDAA